MIVTIHEKCDNYIADCFENDGDVFLKSFCSVSCLKLSLGP